MNALQHIPRKTYGPVLVTLNPPFDPDPSTVRGRWQYDHPILDQQAVQAQGLMNTIQNKRGILYAGAYLNFGFHEDGFTSGLVAATQFEGVDLPFDLQFAPGSVWDERKGATTIAEGNDLVVEGLAMFFDFLQGYGVRHLAGKILGVVLSYYLWILSFFGIRFDL